MSFEIYSKVEGADGQIRFERIGDLPLTGEDGVFARWLKGFKEADTPVDWVLGAATAIHLCLGETTDESRVVLLDLGEGDAVNLNLVRGFRGSSDEDSTDLVVMCTPLGEARLEPSGYSIPGPIGREEWLEALGLSGGTCSGRYFWKAPKMDIGAAVRPAAAREVNP